MQARLRWALVCMGAALGPARMGGALGVLPQACGGPRGHAVSKEDALADFARLQVPGANMTQVLVDMGAALDAVTAHIASLTEKNMNICTEHGGGYARDHPPTPEQKSNCAKIFQIVLKPLMDHGYFRWAHRVGNATGTPEESDLIDLDPTKHMVMWSGMSTIFRWSGLSGDWSDVQNHALSATLGSNGWFTWTKIMTYIGFPPDGYRNPGGPTSFFYWTWASELFSVQATSTTVVDLYLAADCFWDPKTQKRDDTCNSTISRKLAPGGVRPAWRTRSDLAVNEVPHMLKNNVSKINIIIPIVHDRPNIPAIQNQAGRQMWLAGSPREEYDLLDSCGFGSIAKLQKLLKGKVETSCICVNYRTKKPRDCPQPIDPVNQSAPQPIYPVKQSAPQAILI